MIKVNKLCLQCSKKNHGKGKSCPATLTAMAVHSKIVQKYDLGAFKGESNKQRKVMKEAQQIAGARTEFVFRSQLLCVLTVKRKDTWLLNALTQLLQRVRHARIAPRKAMSLFTVQT